MCSNFFIVQFKNTSQKKAKTKIYIAEKIFGGLEQSSQSTIAEN